MAVPNSKDHRLEDVDLYGATTRHGPVSAFTQTEAPFMVYSPTVVK